MEPRPFRVLVVDDEKAIHLAVVEVLESCEVRSALSVAEAREKLTDDIEVALVDKNLPDGSGVDLISELRARVPTLEVIVFTAYPSMESVIHALERGAFDYVPKPFHVADLELKVRNAAQKCRLVRDEARLLAELKESEELHRTLFESSPDAILLLDAKTLTIRAANRAATRTYRLSREQLVGKTESDLLHRDPPSFSFDPRNLIAGLTWHRRSSGEAFPADISRGLCSLGGEDLVLHVVRDVSDILHAEKEQRALREQLWQAQKTEALGILAGGITHDFNNLLVVFSAEAGFLREFLEQQPELPGVQEALDDVSQIEEAAQSARHLTRQLLIFARREAHKPEVLDLNKAVRELSRMLTRFVEAPIKFSLELGAEVPPVHMERGHLEQVIMNLVLNARDAMPTGGTIVIRTVQFDKSWVRLLVQDTGLGMDEATKAKIFDPFFTTKGVSKGTGLGLPTVRSIVEAAGGRIAVESEVGVGTTFTIELPASPVPPERVLGKGEVQGRADEGRGQRIFVVEDHPQVRRAITRCLRAAGYEVNAAATAETALEKLPELEGLVQLWLIDAVLPCMSGREFGDRLTQRVPTARILWTTGYPLDSLRERGYLRPADVTLHKPFSDNELLRAIRTELSRDHAASPEKLVP